jgi:hypothetical protein
MSEHRSSWNSNGQETRSHAATDRMTEADHETAQTHKVTRENSLLRDEANAERAREASPQAVESRRYESEPQWREPGLDPDDEPRLSRGRRGNGAAADPSVTSLLRSLAGDAGTLARKEVALARNEITEAVGDVKTGIISMATGGGVLFSGFLFLLLAATYGLSTIMEAWLAALIVGGVVTLIGAILVMTGRQKTKAEHLRPDRTADALRKDKAMLDRRT